MSSSKFDQMYKFLFDYNNEITRNVPENLKCYKCRNILINSYQIQCGCSYCHVCLESMIKNGVENCPGNTIFCKNNFLSNNYLDNKTNNEISKYVMKCPEEMCLYESELINMEDHLRVCGKKYLSCPFANLGCDDKKKMSTEMIISHCQSANFIHCKLLIEMIDNIRNEIVGLKSVENQNKKEIDQIKLREESSQMKIEELEGILKLKDQIIISMHEEINLIKLENEKFQRECESIKQNNNSKIKIIDNTVDNKIDKIQTGNNKQEEYVELKNANYLDETKIENQLKIESIKEIEIEINTKLDQMKTLQDEFNEISELKNRLFEWTVDNLDEKIKIGGGIWSECFTGLIKQYQFQLLFHGNGFGDFIGIGCSVFLYLWPGPYNNSLPRSFTAEVTLRLVNKDNRKINKSITKPCCLNTILTYPNNCSERFDYLYSDLIDDGIIVDNCFVVECFVKLV